MSNPYRQCAVSFVQSPLSSITDRLNCAVVRGRQPLWVETAQLTCSLRPAMGELIALPRLPSWTRYTATHYRQLTVNSYTAAGACYWAKRHSAVLRRFLVLRNFWHSGTSSLLRCLLASIISVFVIYVGSCRAVAYFLHRNIAVATARHHC